MRFWAKSLPIFNLIRIHGRFLDELLVDEIVTCEKTERLLRQLAHDKVLPVRHRDSFAAMYIAVTQLRRDMQQQPANLLKERDRDESP
jgi:hypothetical protein